MFNAFEIFVQCRILHETAIKSNVSDEVIEALRLARMAAAKEAEERYPELFNALINS